MSRKKKKIAGMSYNAQVAMYNVGKESYEKATRVTRGVDSVGTLAFAQHCSSYSKEGFKKGYDVGRREERRKSHCRPRPSLRRTSPTVMIIDTAIPVGGSRAFLFKIEMLNLKS